MSTGVWFSPISVEGWVSFWESGTSTLDRVTFKTLSFSVRVGPRVHVWIRVRAHLTLSVKPLR